MKICEVPKFKNQHLIEAGGSEINIKWGRRPRYGK
jgi:hypothetical protein